MMQERQQNPNYPPQSARYPQNYPLQSAGYPHSRVLDGFDTHEDDDTFSFSDKTVRQDFIRKVYTMLTIQLVVTTVIVAVFTLVDEVKMYVNERPALFWVAFVITIVVYLMIACCGDLRRNFPINLICLAVFTLAEGFLLGVISIKHKQETVLLAAVITCLITAGLTAFACQTSCDFTAFGGILCAASIVIFIFGLVCIFFPGKTMMLIFSSAAALLFSIYIVYDTQMMMGGHKYSLSPDEYVFATLNLYMDIVMLFMYIMTILGILGDE